MSRPAILCGSGFHVGDHSTPPPPPSQATKRPPPTNYANTVQNMSNGSQSSSTQIRATYDSPSGHEDFVYSIVVPPEKDGDPVAVETRTKYLSDLRASSKKLQDDINKFLTEKMEEDKRATKPGSSNGATKQKSNDELEEENYGEENTDET